MILYELLRDFSRRMASLRLPIRGEIRDYLAAVIWDRLNVVVKIVKSVFDCLIK